MPLSLVATRMTTSARTKGLTLLFSKYPDEPTTSLVLDTAGCVAPPRNVRQSLTCYFRDELRSTDGQLDYLEALGNVKGLAPKAGRSSRFQGQSR